ncbi:type II toxin-antitoxin system YhaV family toxin [Photorhabdus bodei]|uniref:type II toxin-antitoxin system YhaV family toxin n=1 Tax=Photorhabdus bodei TaxID=2029681 RepID=UPI00236814C4|nr:type II toxin-antitoxin system YhaV family toxin [Photorhabdus bodei]
MYDRVCVINGWALFAHPCFIEQLKQAIDKVVQLQQKYPNDYLKKNDTKRLAAIIKLVTEIIPNDPANIYLMDFKMHRGGKGANPREHR